MNWSHDRHRSYWLSQGQQICKSLLCKYLIVRTVTAEKTGLYKAVCMQLPYKRFAAPFNFHDAQAFVAEKFDVRSCTIPIPLT